MDSSPGANNFKTWQPGFGVASYTLIRELARGGMGEIWLARQHHAADFERLVVIKRAVPDAEDEASASTALFLEEARISVQLQHPNIVQVYEFGFDHGSYFLVMERLEGQSLSRLMRWAGKARQPVPPRLAVEIVATAARGLGYAHRRRDAQGNALNIVHRDISPQNLFVTYDGEVKVLDFGIGKIAGRKVRTATGVVRGKLEYMSPEQALGQAVSAASDVFSLGVVLFELVTGTRLYGVNTDHVSILNRLAYASPAPRASERVELDPRLDEMIATALKWNPFDRFPDGQALFEALEAVSATLPKTQGLSTLMRTVFAQELAAAPLQAMADVTPSAVLPTQSDPVAAPARSWKGLLAVPVVLVIAVVAAVARFERPGAGAGADSGSGIRAFVESPPSPDAGLVEAAVALDDHDSGVTPVVMVKAPRRTGRLTLQTDPWVRVFLGDKLIGETPLIDVPLPSGLTRLRLVNQPAKIDTFVEFEIKPDARVTKRLVL